MKRLFQISIERMPYWFGLISTGVFLYFTIIVLPHQSALAVENGLLYSIDTTFFTNARRLYEIAEAYGASGRSFYIYQRWTFDLVWPMVYTAFIFSLSSLLYKSIGLSSFNYWILSFSWIAMALDYLENTMVTIVMVRFPQPTWVIADLAGTVTSLKWIAIGISFVILFLLVVLKITQIVLWQLRRHKR